MAIFSRRVLQQLVDNNAAFLTKSQLEAHVQDLDEGKLETEWEIAILNALCQFGNIDYERGNQTRPDIFFTHRNDPKAKFVADIRTLLPSREDENVNTFSRKLGSTIRNLAVRGRIQTEIRRLPGSYYLDEAVFETNDFEGFIDSLKTNPKRSIRCEIENHRAHLIITFQPGSGSTSGIQWTGKVTHRIRNRLMSALEEKYLQLKNAGVNPPWGVFVCDGGSRLLRNDGGFPIEWFLKEHPLIGFVVTCIVRNSRTPEVSIYKGNGFTELSSKVIDVLNKLENYLPAIERTPENALAYLKGKSGRIRDRFWSCRRSWSPGEWKVKISSRILLELLAGEITHQEFLELLNIGSGSSDVFREHLKNGRLLNAVVLEKTDSDDDWIEFTFGEPDPAVIPFRVPEG